MATEASKQCPRCNGFGRLTHKFDRRGIECPDCEGTGVLPAVAQSLANRVKPRKMFNGDEQ